MNCKGNTKQKEQYCRYHSTWLQTILQSLVIKTACYWHKNKHEHQWNRIEYPDTNLHRYNHMTFDKGTQNMHWRKDSLFHK
jgi:hypothetical protein